MANSPTSTASSAATYEIDPAHSSASFKVRHMMIANVKGSFNKLEGSVVFDARNPEAARIDARIDAASIDTREPQRDAHLRSADFLDVENYPQLTFRSKSVKSIGENEYELTGDLTIRGVTREVKLQVESTPEVKDPWGNLRVGATATTVINRKDFGLTWNTALETGGVLVGDRVDITLDLEFVKKAQAG
jgi:polyisoprenoid-binding protein YceI